MMIREFLENRRKAEYPAFVNVLKALPKERFDYRPHERSPSAAEIVWTLARETKACCDLIDTGQVNWTPAGCARRSGSHRLRIQEALCSLGRSNRATQRKRLAEQGATSD